MNKEYNVVSFSGGKDSTAVLFGLLERGIPINEVIFFDTGWEFPEMYDHLALVEQKSGLKITRLAPPQSFDYWLLSTPVKYRSGEFKGQARRIGNGWPSPFRRWCTRIKIRAIEYYLRGQQQRADVGEIAQCIGFAADELHRTQGKEFSKAKFGVRYPLIEWGMDEAAALQYCKSLGFNWSGLYDVFHRVSCYCCPLQSLANLKALRRHYPHLWAKMLDYETRMDKTQLIRFNHEASIHQLDVRFNIEEGPC